MPRFGSRPLSICFLALLWGLASASPSPFPNAQTEADPSTPAANGSSGTAPSFAGPPNWFHIPSNLNAVRIAHVVIGAIAVLLIMPGGAVFVRLFGRSFYNGVWVHSAIQMFGYLVYCTSAGLGIWLARAYYVIGDPIYLHPKLYHPIIGIIVMILLFILPVGQLASHFIGKRNPELQHTKLRRTAAVHLWLGRVLLLLGIVNGGLGFPFADQLPDSWANNAPRIVYGVVATIVVFMYMVVVAIWGPERDQRKMSQTSDRVRDEEMQGLSHPQPVNGNATVGGEDPNSRPNTAESSDSGAFKSNAL